MKTLVTYFLFFF